MVLVNTKRRRPADTATSRTWRRPSTFVRYSWGRVAQIGPGVDDAVEDDVAAGHRSAQRLVVEDVAVVALHRKPGDAARRTGLAQQHPDAVAALDELAGHMRAEEPARADHELVRHARSMPDEQAGRQHRDCVHRVAR